ncbi:unnamed protein product [Cylindrotheca closterium]|uniref:HSF-type DNA-binding domain-containing protein n=1 Tax=Cylindrotheca closterium TaxID=2856 RepID=A0AAD2CWQ1_9STRA|nr:unnamed protein product [Cylindrotheca closterium]
MQCISFSAMPATQETPRKDKIPRLGRNSSFPLKLHQLLCYATANNLEDIICWSGDGKGFHVLDPNELMKRIAPLFFPNQARFRSFERMLNIWGFQRESAPRKTKSFWCNPNFQRHRSDLCRYMTRIENKGTKKRIPTGPSSYGFVKTKVQNSQKQVRKLHSALKFLSDETTLEKEEHCQSLTQSKGTKTRLPLKKREMLSGEQGCNNEESRARQLSYEKAITSSPAQSLQEMKKATSIVATVPCTRQQDKPVCYSESSRPFSCNRDEEMEHSSTAACHQQPKPASKERATFVRRRILPTRTRSKQSDFEELAAFQRYFSSRYCRNTEPHYQKAVPNRGRNSISNGILSKEPPSGQRTSSLIDEENTCGEADFGRLLQSGSTTEKKKSHIEGQFDDAPDDSDD